MEASRAAIRIAVSHDELIAVRGCGKSRNHGRWSTLPCPQPLHVWQDEGRVFHSDFDGKEWSKPAIVSSGRLPALSAIPSGGMCITWTGRVGGTTQVFYRQFDRTKWLEAEQVTDTKGTSYAATISIDDLGVAHIAWMDDTPGNIEILYLMREMGPRRSLSEEADSPSRLEALAKLGEAEVTRNKQGDITEIKLRVFNRQITDAQVKELKGMTELVNLQLMGNGITDSGLQHLKGLANLRKLSLSFSQVSDTGLEHLEGLTDLTMLDLSFTQVTGAGLKHLRELTNLTELQLSMTQVTDNGLENLKGLTSLTTLGLLGTRVTDSGVAELKKSLPGCDIKRISLSLD
jgi:Leucine-rich repeat (LRR) protein